MTNVILVANWKQSGKRTEALTWIDTFDKERSILSKNVQIIVCPPLKALDLVAEQISAKNLPIDVGIQDIDPIEFEGEKNTGANSPALLTDSANYAIVGHSETRRNFALTDEDITKKVTGAKKNNLIPIVCISTINQVSALKSFHPDFDAIIAYEPLFAIGSGNPDTPENANAVGEKIKEIFSHATVIYGGSVEGGNVKSFLQQSNISGVLVGNRSLDGNFFLEIVKNAH